MVGIPLLAEMAEEVYGDQEATSALFKDDPIRVRKRGSGYVLTIRLPFVSREDMDIHRKGEELYIRVGTYKRNLIPPQTLKRMTVREANLAGITSRSCSVASPDPNPRDGGNRRWLDRHPRRQPG